MKRYAVADEVPEDCDYLTAGKEYEIKIGCVGDYLIKSDDGELLGIEVNDCYFLNGKSWRIVEREE